MNTYRIPQTDLVVSRVAYGTWNLGGSWDDSPLTSEVKDHAHQLIMAVAEHGINHIDLADIYVRGKSDEAVGHVLRQHPGLREQLILQAKCGIVLSNSPNLGDPGRYDFSFDHLVAAVEGSLRRLGTDYVDLLALHRPDPLMEPDEVARAVDHLHATGKVRYFGVSNHNVGQLELLRRSVRQPLVVNQLQLSLLHHYLISDGFVTNRTDVPYTAGTGLLDYCRLQDMLVQAWSPVARGAIFHPSSDAPPHVHEVSIALEQIADSHQTTVEAIAVAWLLRHPAPIQPILGTLSLERLSRSIPADDLEISRIEWYRLLAAARGCAVP